MLYSRLKTLIKSNPFTYHLCKLIIYFFYIFPLYIFSGGKVCFPDSPKKLSLFIYSNMITNSELYEQRRVEWKESPLISLITPLYNTEADHLIEMLNSVINQTYKNIEICLTDGSDDKHQYVEEICKKYAANDSRIMYRKLEVNAGISGNTNKALEIANGKYYALLDHDDLLAPNALFECVLAALSGADFIYTDEATFEGDLSHILSVHLKPDFAIDNLRANNYICHLSFFSSSLIKKVGGLSSKCDGSQDHDLFLKLVEVAENIYHIPKVLYYWRAHASSTAF